MTTIHFDHQHPTFSLKNRINLRHWVNACATEEKKTIQDVHFVFCNKSYLLKINKQFLQHHYHTDVIGFDYSDTEGLKGEIYISIDEVKLNAKRYKITMIEELHRVIIHGFLHFCGYKDSTQEGKKLMQKREDYYLNKLHKTLI